MCSLRIFGNLVNCISSSMKLQRLNLFLGHILQEPGSRMGHVVPQATPFAERGRVWLTRFSTHVETFGGLVYCHHHGEDEEVLLRCEER